MALSVDSSCLRWQGQVKDSFFQTPSESTPLLSEAKERHNYNLSQHRIVFPNNKMFHQDWAKVSKLYSGNRIHTTKYTLLNFLPRNLFEQFHRWANLYFLFLVILNWMPSIEVFHREITMLPLAIVLLIIMVKDGMEDYKKYRFDQEINSSNIQIYEKKILKVTWQDKAPGHLEQNCQAFELYCREHNSRWADRVVQMPKLHLPERLFYSKLTQGRHSHGGQKKQDFWYQLRCGRHWYRTTQWGTRTSKKVLCTL